MYYIYFQKSFINLVEASASEGKAMSDTKEPYGVFINFPLGNSPLANFHLDLWKESPELALQPQRIADDAAYSQALSSFVLVCSDVLLINKENGAAYLARRRVKPMQDQWWYIGGRRMFGEAPLVGLARCFCRETSLQVDHRRFKFVAEYEYLFKDRQQQPQDAGTHALSHTFVIELSGREIKRASSALNAEEYYTDLGLQEMSEIAAREPIHPSITGTYNRYLTMKQRHLI